MLENHSKYCVAYNMKDGCDLVRLSGWAEQSYLWYFRLKKDDFSTDLLRIFSSV